MQNLEYLSIQKLIICSNAFNSLNRLKKLALSYCDLSECTDYSFENLFNLEVFENYQPTNHFHLNLSAWFLNIKWLFLSKIDEFDFLTKLNETLLIFEINNSFKDSKTARSILEKFENRNIKVLLFSRNCLNRFDLAWLSGLRQLNNLKLKRNKVQVFENSGDDLSRLEYLDLSGNLLRTLDSEIFSKLSNSIRVIDLGSNLELNLTPGVFKNLKNLEELYLRNCQLEKYLDLAGKESFCDLCSLNILDLSFNQIKTFDSEIFSFTSKLSVLNLANNMLSLQSDSFRHLRNLKCLNLNENMIKYLSDGLFNGLENLEILRLSRNLISQIEAKTFEGLANLKKLCLKMNSLEEIDSKIFLPISSLKEVDLSLMNILEDNKKEILASCLLKNVKVIF